MRKRVAGVLAFIAFTAGLAVATAPREPAPPIPAPIPAAPAGVEVVRIVDGDGIHVAGETLQVRLFGVDAPERGEPGFAEATETLRRLALGKIVRVDRQYLDGYGRIVGRVWLGDVEINAEVIRIGPAIEHCRYSKNAYGHCPDPKPRP
jgi:endonuclease YncB( thermonuclease family)